MRIGATRPPADKAPCPAGILRGDRHSCLSEPVSGPGLNPQTSLAILEGDKGAHRCMLAVEDQGRGRREQEPGQTRLAPRRYARMREGVPPFPFFPSTSISEGTSHERTLCLRRLSS